MGVPKFFRYISERYPNLSELVGSAELPRFDNMYLDMNGIIHVCSHPDDSNVHFRMSEELMFQNILHYIDALFRMIQPQKVFFMAVDGVAPRAKMNQQRGRRFQSARTAIELIERAKKSGEKLPDESRFDSNCITPGTVFMVRLQEVFKHFVKMKLSTDPLWQHCRIILSGHETPGEGEHKIMEYIRYLKSKPGYDPNTRHCLYGLDADLIMLGLCSHELNFALLREEVKFDKKAKRPLSVDETQFNLLHLGLLREYLELEFVELKPQLKFDYDIEKIIDDWIFMCFMVGNDFIPHLPNLHINSNALPLLYKVYKKVLPQLDGYLNEGGQLKLARFEKFMEEMAEIDRDLFREHYEDLKLFETKYDNDETFGANISELPPAKMDPALADLVKRTMLEFSSDDESTSDSSDDDESESSLLFDGQKAADVFAGVDDDDDLDNDQLFEKEFAMHKRNYYITKMKYPEMTEEVLAEQTKCYVTALQWILSYYYRGVCSWSWYYPHHYAPYMSDIKNFKNLQLDYNLGHPFLPFEQLLSVLPTASKELLPTAYHNLMTDSSSKIIDYYPVDFKTDLNGKKQEWEALVLIPFINEKRLMDAMNDCNERLTDNEKDRNKHGPMLQYDYCDVDQGSESEKCGLPMIGHVFCKETGISRDELMVPTHELVLGPCSGASKDAYFPGFPTMRHLKHSAKLDMKRIKVFQQPSRNESMIISIDETPIEADIKALAKQFVGQEVYIGWPHLRLAKVFAVSDFKTRIEKSGIEEFKEGNREFNLQARHVAAHHLLRLGIDLGDINQLLHVYPLANREYMNTNDGKLTLSKNWSKIPLAVAPISVVRNIKVYEKELQRFKKIEDVFTKDSIVFLMTKDYYGCEATITDSLIRNGRIKIQTMKYPQPDFTRARQMHKAESQSYMNSYTASTRIGLNSRLFNRITSCVLIVSGEKRFPISDSDKKTNVGLNLKHLKQNEEIPGYTKSANNQWLYSQNAIDVVHAYHEKFPKLFELMNNENKDGKDFIFESELNEGRAAGEESLLKEIQRWLKEHPCTSINRQPCGTECLSTNCISAVAMDVYELKSKPVNVVRLQIKPHLLYKPNLNDINVLPERDVTFQLFDRVIIARDNYIVPLGMRGTVIAILPISDPNPVRQENINVIDHLFEVLFDAPFERGTTVPGVEGNRVLKVRKSVLINVSHGIGRPREEMDYERNWRLENGNGRMNMKDRKAQELRETFGSVNESSPPVENYWRSRNQKPQQQQETFGSVNESTPPVENYWRSRNQKPEQQQQEQLPQNPRSNGTPSKKPGSTMALEKKMSDLNWRIKDEPQQQAPLNQNNGATDSGDALRKLLRIGNEAPLQNNITQPNVSQPWYQSLDEFFGKVPNGDEKIMPSLASLPKPPANWHQKLKPEPTVEPEPIQQHPNQPNMIPLSNVSMFPQPLYNFPPQGMPGNMPGSMPFAFQPPHHMMPPQMMAPHMVSQSNYPWYHMPGPLPFTNQGHHVRMPVVQSFNQQHVQQMHGQPPVYQQSMHQPEGPGNLKKDMYRNASYNSAFIPLQAARKITKSKSGGNGNAPTNRENIDDKNDAEATKKPNSKAPYKSNKDNQPTEHKNKPQAHKSKQAQDIKPNAAKNATKSQNNENVQIENKFKVEPQAEAVEKDKSMPNSQKTPSKRLACNFSIKPVEKKSQPN